MHSLVTLSVAVPAGGLAAYLHVDWYAEQAPAGVKARGMPDSGCVAPAPAVRIRERLGCTSFTLVGATCSFFMDGNYTRDGKADYEGRMVGRGAGVDACVA